MNVCLYVYLHLVAAVVETVHMHSACAAVVIRNYIIIVITGSLSTHNWCESTEVSIATEMTI